MESNYSHIKKALVSFVSLTQIESWSVKELLNTNVNYNKKYPLKRIGEFLIKSSEITKVQNDTIYQRIKVKLRNGGIKQRDIIKGIEIGTKKQFIAHSGQFILSKIDARNGAFGIIPENLDKAIVTNDFPLFDIEQSKIIPQFLVLITTTEPFIRFVQSSSSGTTNRQRIDINLFLNQKIPLPILSEQVRIVNAYNKKMDEAIQLEIDAKAIEEGIEKYLFEKLEIKETTSFKMSKGINFASFKSIVEWGIDKIITNPQKNNSKLDYFPISKIALDAFRGKSPLYNEKSNKFILNQKCNRWNYLDLSFVKKVDSQWLHSIDKDVFTKEGDILINSTGEGTIGRATYITKEYEGLLFDTHMLLLRINTNKMNPELFVELFNSSFGQSQVNNFKSAQATKQTELGVNNLYKIGIPVPESLEFQIDVVQKIKNKRLYAFAHKKKAESLRVLANKEFENEIFGK